MDYNTAKAQIDRVRAAVDEGVNTAEVVGRAIQGVLDNTQTVAATKADTQHQHAMADVQGLAAALATERTERQQALATEQQQRLADVQSLVRRIQGADTTEGETFPYDRTYPIRFRQFGGDDYPLDDTRHARIVKDINAWLDSLCGAATEHPEATLDDTGTQVAQGLLRIHQDGGDLWVLHQANSTVQRDYSQIALNGALETIDGKEYLSTNNALASRMLCRTSHLGVWSAWQPYAAAPQHQHTQADVQGLAAALAGKADTAALTTEQQQRQQADTALATRIDGKADTQHQHTLADTPDISKFWNDSKARIEVQDIRLRNDDGEQGKLSSMTKGGVQFNISKLNINSQGDTKITSNDNVEISGRNIRLSPTGGVYIEESGGAHRRFKAEEYNCEFGYTEGTGGALYLKRLQNSTTEKNTITFNGAGGDISINHADEISFSSCARVHVQAPFLMDAGGSDYFHVRCYGAVFETPDFDIHSNVIYWWPDKDNSHKHDIAADLYDTTEGLMARVAAIEAANTALAARVQQLEEAAATSTE